MTSSLKFDVSNKKNHKTEQNQIKRKIKIKLDLFSDEVSTVSTVTVSSKDSSIVAVSFSRSLSEVMTVAAISISSKNSSIIAVSFGRSLSKVMTITAVSVSSKNSSVVAVSF